MKNTRQRLFDVEGPCCLHLVVLVISFSSFLLNSQNAHSTLASPVEYRAGKVIDKFDDTWQYAAVFKVRPPRKLRSSFVELAIGVTTDDHNFRPFVSLGPVWQIPLFKSPFSLNVGISPTLFAGSTFNDRDIGGNFHFTSSAAVEGVFGKHRALLVALRIQHTSNGGLSNRNPGMDIVGLAFSYQFDQ